MSEFQYHTVDLDHIMKMWVNHYVRKPYKAEWFIDVNKNKVVFELFYLDDEVQDDNDNRNRT